jgi:ketosteroid isomerase-like protein
MTISENKALIRSYFDAISHGEADIADLFADEISWWVPAGSDFGGLHEGKEAVMAFLAGGVGYYAEEAPMLITIEQIIAEDDWVACQFTIEATTASGKPYKNYYHFAFQIEQGKIRFVKEYLDTHYAKEAFKD